MSTARAQDAFSLWGAVVVGPDGAYGWASNANTEIEAEQAADANCSYQCETGFTFYDSCGAIAVSHHNAFWGHGDERFIAEANAMDACEQQFGFGCAINVWACTD